MIKKLLLSAIIGCVSSLSWAQPDVESSQGNRAVEAPVFAQEKAIGEVCGEYPNRYLMHKVTGLAYYYLGNDANANWFERVAQYNECPQEMTIHGVGFAGFTLGVPSVDAVVQLFSTNADSTGNVLLASDTVTVSAGSYSASGMVSQYYEADFDTPVTVNQPYLVLVKNTTADTLCIYASDAGAHDGQGEERALQYYNNPMFPSFIGWYHYESSQATTDLDYILSPVVSYETSVLPTLSATMLCEGDNFCLDYIQTAGFRDHTYSMRSGTDSLDQIQMTWGDGLQISNLSLACHAYTDTGNMVINVKDTIYTYGIPGSTQYCPVEFDTTVYVLSEPIVDLSSDSDGTSLTITFTDESDYGDSFSWDFGDGNTSGSQNPVHTYNANGTYMVYLTVTNSCGSATDSLELDLTSVGIEETTGDENAFTIYPNPATQNVVIQCNDKAARTLEIVNTLGQKVARIAVNGSSKYSMNVQNWSTGMYFVQIKGAEGATLGTQKLIVK